MVLSLGGGLGHAQGFPLMESVLDQKKLCQVAAICGGLVFIGCLLPWITVSLPAEALAAAERVGMAIPQTSFNATSGNFTAGVLVLILGLVGGAAAALTGFGFVKAVPLPQKTQWLIAAGCFAVSALFVVINFLKDFGGASRGLGLWLSLLASLGGTAAMFLLLKKAGMLPKPDAGTSGDKPAGGDGASS